MNLGTFSLGGCKVPPGTERQQFASIFLYRRLWHRVIEQHITIRVYDRITADCSYHNPAVKDDVM